MNKRQLILENGSVFAGEGFGSEKETYGEVVFHTGMTGYQEIITDPSNYGEIVVMTYPLVGNYGINRDDFENITPFLGGLIVKEASDNPSNFRSDETLDNYLKVHHIPGLQGIDTRKLTNIIREHGTMKGCIVGADDSADHYVERLKQSPVSMDQVKQTSTVRPYVVPGRGLRIVLVDLGMKHGILRELTKRDCHVTVVPYHYGAENIMRLKPDGILLSNGPGNPEDVPEAIAIIKDVLGKIPLFGIGLGHQLFALSCGAETVKMKFGHRSTSSPVKDLTKKRVFMTSQNHSYTVRRESLGNTKLELTQIALNDNTVEGLKHQTFPAFSVQYNPESSPGSEDANQVFAEFLQMIKKPENGVIAYA